MYDLNHIVMSPHRLVSSQPSCTDCISCKYSLFGDLPKNELQEFSKTKVFHFYKKGQLIFHEGNYPAGLYCIFSGKVKVYKLGPDSREQIVRLAKPGKVLGYRALLSNDKYYASATALEDTHVCFFPKASFLELLQQNLPFALKTVELLSSDLRYAEKMIMNLAQKTVKSRIAEALLTLQEYYGMENSGGAINSTIRREDIGNMAGTTTETTIRVLSDLKKEGIISLEGKKIVINDLNQLRIISEDLNTH